MKKIKFKDDIQDWENKVLKDIYTFAYSGGTPQSSNTEFYNGNIPFLTISDINDKKYINDTKKHISEKGLKNSNAKIMPKGTLSLAMYASVGKVCILNQNIATSQAFFNMIFDSDFTRNFIYQKLINMNNKKQWSLYILTGTQPNLNAETISTYIVKLPNKEIQQKIAKLLTIIDDKIEYQKNKLSKLQKIKFSMLNIILPKENTNVPKLRFKGFTEDWEQRKAADIAEYSKGNGYSKSDLTEIGTPIILYGRLYTKYQFVINEIDTFAAPKEGAVYSEGNEVIVPSSGETAEDIARASAVEKSGVLLGGDLNILRPFDFINPLFLALVISNGEPQKELAKRAQGKSVVHIHNSDIQELSISYPTRTEQDQIVAVFRNLDNLITLHQRKCEKLQQIKQALLEKLIP